MTEVIFPEAGRRGSEGVFPGGGVGALEGVAAGRRLPFFLAAEEYLARRAVRSDEPVAGREVEAGEPGLAECLNEGGLFFLWQSGPTVIFGRNQDPAAELDVEWCRAHGVEYYRRKSGGGCVYSDRGNIMISCIYPGSGVQENFAKFSEAVCGALRSLGLPAEVSGRNDILIDGRKVSGSAFFALPSSSIVHSTMLYETDFASMEAALRPSRLKLGAKGVRSVSSRVCSVREFLPELPLESFAKALRRALSAGGGRLVLGPEDLARIEEIEMSYLDEAFIEGRFGGAPCGAGAVAGGEASGAAGVGAGAGSDAECREICREAYVPGCGCVNVSLRVRGGKIFNVSLIGDFFAASEEVGETLSRLLAGRRPVREDVEAALEGVALEKIVRGLSTRAFVDILLGNG